MKVVLELQDQPSNVRRITIRHDIVIGRGSDCNLRLSAPQVSRRHCFLRVGRDSVSVTDLDSSNGTFVDGRRITAGKRCDIADGSQLALGPVKFTVHLRIEAVADGGKSRSMLDDSSVVHADDSRHKFAASHSLNDDSVTVDGRTRELDAGVPMEYSVENGGKSAEPYAATDEIEGQFSVSGVGEILSSDSNPMDSRLEIIDFGRRLSEGISNDDEPRAAARGGISSKPGIVEEDALDWGSANFDSADSSGVVDILSIVDDSSVNCSANDIANVDANESGLPVKKETGDKAAGSETAVTETVATRTPESADGAENAGDEIDPDRQSSLKGS